MKGVGPHRRTQPIDRARSARASTVLWLTVAASLIGAVACAIDNHGGQSADGRPVSGSGGRGGEGAAGGVSGVGGAVEFPDAGAPDQPSERGVPPMETPLMVMDCSASTAPNELCCASALGFEDGSSQHFLTPACCRMALSMPQVVPTPTACGRAALRLDANFGVVDPSSLCGQTGEAMSCAFQMGEVSRAVLAPLDLTGFTLTAMVYLDGPPLPASLADGSLFVVGRAGLVAGIDYPIAQIGTWTRLELPFAADTMEHGVDIRVLGIRMTFHGQPWVGHAYIDEITWH